MNKNQKNEFNILQSSEIATSIINNNEMVNFQFTNINSIIKFDEDNIPKNYSLIEDDYLPIDDFNYKSDLKSLNKNFENLISKYDKKDLLDLKKQIQRCTLNDLNINNNINVGPISTLDFLVETSYKSDYIRKKSIIENFISLEDLVFRWRSIGGDGNCYYRAVIFAYFENLIFQENIDLLKYLILDMYEAFFDDEYFIKKINALGLKSELIIKIFILIYFSLLSSKGDDGLNLTYELYIKCFNSCKHFDYGLIFYFRYKLYNFIKINENKLYSKLFSVKIGNLLPVEYETNKEEFLYDQFYEDFLMKFYKDAEKIVIYLTPFVLKVNINILVYDFCKNNVEKLKTFPCLLSDNNINTLTLLYKRSHYDLVYDEKIFMNYSKYLSLYVNLNENLRIINVKSIHEYKSKKGAKNNLDLAEEERRRSYIHNQKMDMVNENKKEFKDINIKPDIEYSDDPKKKNAYNIQSYDNKVLYHQGEYKSQSYLPQNLSFQNNKNEIIDSPINTLQPKLFCCLCKNKYIPCNNILKICLSCLLSEIKNNISIKYFKFISESKLYFDNVKNLNEIGRLFKTIIYDSKIQIMDQSLNVAQALKLVGKDFNEIIDKEIKPSKCLTCDKITNLIDSSLQTYTLPCKCFICCYKCLRSYFEIFFKGNIDMKELYCFCGKNYNNYLLRDLLNFSNFNNLKKYKEKIVDIYKEKIRSQCMICLSERTKKGDFCSAEAIVICELNDETVESIFGLKKFNHFMCKICLDQIHPSSESELKCYDKNYKVLFAQLCMICNSIHKITSFIIKKASTQFNLECSVI